MIFKKYMNTFFDLSDNMVKNQIVLYVSVMKMVYIIYTQQLKKEYQTNANGN